MFRDHEFVGEALKFLAKAFGFRKYGEQMLGPDGKINHAAIRVGDDLIMLGSFAQKVDRECEQSEASC